MDIVESEEYGSSIQINVFDRRDLSVLRRMLGRSGEAPANNLEVETKVFLKRMVRQDWTATYSDLWLKMIDMVIDHSDTHDTLNFVYSEEIYDA